MKLLATRIGVAIGLAFALLTTPASAHSLREQGETVKVARSDMVVTPSRDWNRLNGRPGKRAEVWTLDGPQLNDVTFFGGVERGDPLVKERSKKRDPLPKFSDTTLLIEVPELLEGTYRTYKGIGEFTLLSIEPMTFLEHEGVYFTFEFIDRDQLPRKGEARAAIIDDELFMITFEAPRLHYFDKVIEDFRQIADSASLD